MNQSTVGIRADASAVSDSQDASCSWTGREFQSLEVESQHVLITLETTHPGASLQAINRDTEQVRTIHKREIQCHQMYVLQHHMLSLGMHGTS